MTAREISMIGNGKGHQRDMKILPTTFRSGSFDFELLKRDGDIALFRKTKPRLRFESLEVVIIQTHETFEIKGKLIPAGEHLPPSGQWGVKGWTYSDRPSAERKFNQLISASGFGAPFRCPDPGMESKALQRKRGDQEMAFLTTDLNLSHKESARCSKLISLNKF